MPHFLGLDIGTYDSKGVLTDAEGRIVATANSPHEMRVPRPGWAEHKPMEDWWEGVVAIMRRLLADSGVAAEDIAGVALSAIGPCMLPCRRDGTPLTDAVLYGVDTRAAAQIAALTEGIGADTILARCGNALTSQSVGPKIAWLRDERPDIHAATEIVGSSTTWLTHRLTGEWAIDHYTAANFAPLYDIAAQDWTADLAPDIVALDRLPRLMWSTEIAGHVTEAAAAETGLAPGTPVTCGTIDAAAEAVSVGVRHPGDMMVMYGSTIFVIQLTADRITDPALWTAPWLWPGEHAAMAGLATSGTLTHWFRDRFAQELDRDTAFATLAAEAQDSPPGARGLLFLPYFSGERTPIHDPLAKGALFGLNLTHSRGDIYRAVLEGIAMGTAHVTETYAAAGETPQRILAVGGGVKNALWMQATSDLTGLDQTVCRTTQGASYGDAFLAAVATGHAGRADIDRWNPAARTVEAARHDAYARQFPLFKRLYTQTRDIAHALGRGA
ncbi:carbohydrate kinase [Rhodobacteraceae bacterium CCMM004]|nr:carbohydrate kinase [Rhodobacteraceae bacterium CCMM004]